MVYIRHYSVVLRDTAIISTSLIEKIMGHFQLINELIKYQTKA